MKRYSICALFLLTFTANHGMNPLGFWRSLVQKVSSKKTAIQVNDKIEIRYFVPSSKILYEFVELPKGHILTDLNNSKISIIKKDNNPDNKDFHIIKHNNFSDLEKESVNLDPSTKSSRFTGEHFFGLKHQGKIYFFNTDTNKYRE